MRIKSIYDRILKTDLKTTPAGLLEEDIAVDCLEIEEIVGWLGMS